MIFQLFTSSGSASSKGRAYPKALAILLGAEIPELMGRFGIMATLVLYLTHVLSLSDTQAFAVYGTYLMMSFITPILGGFLADRFLGYQRAVLLGAALMVLGNACLIIPDLFAIYCGLSIMAMGVGFFSPALVALVNALYRDKEDGREQAFVLYYICRNVGALIAPTVCGVIGLTVGYSYAFLFTAICMLIGLGIFMRGQRHLPQMTPSSSTSSQSFLVVALNRFFSEKPYLSYGSLIFLSIILVVCAFMYSLSQIFLIAGGCAVLTIAVRLYQRADAQQRQGLHAILLSIAVMIVFFSINQLCGASFNLFVDRLIHRSVMGFTLPTSVFFSINPLFMIIFGGFFMALINKIRRPNYVTAAFTKYALALGIFALAMFVLKLAAQQAHEHGMASGFYIVVSYSLCALAELCMVPIVIALIGRLAPSGQVGLLMGIYQFGSAIASYITTHIANVAAINFPLTSAHALRHAAGIYQHVFGELALVLITSAVLVCVMRTMVQRAYRQAIRVSPVLEGN
ncbi:MAG TPA: hypothetical protein DCL40_03400 [Coxiellaceae bacterium]|nr:hypothetical protein [Coxiellaceae bacterium]